MNKFKDRFDVLFAFHYDRLVGWCRKRIGIGCEAPEELVHQTYLKCRKTWRADKVRSAYSNPAFLYRALQWVIIDDARRRHRRKLLELACATERRTAIVDLPLAKLIAAESVERLQGHQGRICLAILSGRNLQRVCAENRISEKALAVYLCRARARLRMEFEIR